MPMPTYPHTHTFYTSMSLSICTIISCNHIKVQHILASSLCTIDDNNKQMKIFVFVFGSKNVQRELHTYMAAQVDNVTYIEKGYQ